MRIIKTNKCFQRKCQTSSINRASKPCRSSTTAWCRRTWWATSSIKISLWTYKPNRLSTLNWPNRSHRASWRR